MEPRLPKNAKRVFKGILFDVYHWKQKHFDRSVSTWECVVRKNAATVIATVGNKIILQQQRQSGGESFLSFPGGYFKPPETALEGAKRELLEETGYVSKNWKKFMVFQYTPQIIWNHHLFIAKNCRRVQKPNLDPAEKIKLRLITLKEFLLLTENPRFRHKDFLPFMYQLRLYPKKRAAFRKKLFD